MRRHHDQDRPSPLCPTKRFPWLIFIRFRSTCLLKLRFVTVFGRLRQIPYRACGRPDMSGYMQEGAALREKTDRKSKECKHGNFAPSNQINRLLDCSPPVPCVYYRAAYATECSRPRASGNRLAANTGNRPEFEVHRVESAWGSTTPMTEVTADPDSIYTSSHLTS